MPAEEAPTCDRLLTCKDHAHIFTRNPVLSSPGSEQYFAQDNAGRGDSAQKDKTGVRRGAKAARQRALEEVAGLI